MDPTDAADKEKDSQCRKSRRDLQSLPVAADEAREGNTNVQTTSSEQKDSSDAEGCRQTDPPLPLPPEPSCDSTSGDDKGEVTDRSLATDSMEAGQVGEVIEKFLKSLMVQSDSAITWPPPTEESDFYKGRPSFVARVRSLPSSDQEHNIIRQLHGRLKVFSPLLILGGEGCGKTTAVLMLARRMTVTGEISTTYWYDSDHVSSCWLPSTTTPSLLVIDDFLGHCPSESFTRWRSFCRFMSPEFPKPPKSLVVLTSRTSVFEKFQAWCGVELSSTFFVNQPVTLSMNYTQMWDSTATGSKMKTRNVYTPPSIGFPLCCRLFPHLPKSVQKILFEQPRCALREAVKKVMIDTSVARTALALLAVTDGYLDTSVLLDPAKLQTSRSWKVLSSLEKQPVDGTTITAIMSFYVDYGGLILLEDEFASFVNEAVRESVLVVLCESHDEFLSEFCSLKLLSQIALVTRDVTVHSDRAEKPVLPDCAKSAFLRRMITELEARNYHGVFTCSLLRHASFCEMLAQKINQDLVTTWLDSRDQNGLYFVFYAGAIDSVFQNALLRMKKKRTKMVPQALLACCYWNHADEIDGLWTKLKNQGLNGDLETATIEQILTGDLCGFSPEKAPQWSDVPIYPEDTLVTMAAWRGNDAVVWSLASRRNLSSQGKNGWTALMHYCARGNSKMTSSLLLDKADPLTADATGTTALMYALNQKEWDMPKKLISSEHCEMVNRRGESPLLFACANGWSVHTIENILSQGADTVRKDHRGFTCLHHACLNGHVDVTKYLLKNPNIDLEQKTVEGFTPLFLALTSPDRSEFMKLLLKSCKEKNQFSKVILMVICKYSGKRILEQFFSANHPDDETKFLVLERACAIGNADIVRFLLDKVVDPKLPLNPMSSSTCLHLACTGVSIQTVELLAKRMDCNVKKTSGTTPIMIALKFGRLEFAQLLHSRGALLNVKDDFGGCLHHAVLSDSIRVLEWCVNEHKMDVNERNGKKETPLFLASSEGRTRSMKWLLDHGADVTARDKDGNSCLHAAAQSGCLLAVKILLNKMSPGDLSVCNNSGKTPLQVARESGHNHIVNYLGDFE